MLTLPIKGTESYVISNMHSKHTAYLLSDNFLPHNGVHVYGHREIMSVGDGKVVSLKLIENYDSAPIPEKYIEEGLKEECGNNYESLKKDMNKYFDVKEGKGVRSYVLRKLLEEEEYKLKKYLNLLYSSSYVLLRHETENHIKRKIVYYSLYHHLSAQRDLTLVEKSRLFWYEARGRAKKEYEIYIKEGTAEKDYIIRKVKRGEELILLEPEKILEGKDIESIQRIKLIEEGKERIGYIWLDKKDEDREKRDKYLNTNKIEEKVEICGIEVEIRLKKGITIGKASNCNHLEIAGSNIIGYTGKYFKEERLSHIEVFTGENDFIRKDNGKVKGIKYKVEEEITGYLKSAETEEKKMEKVYGKEEVKNGTLVKIDGKKYGLLSTERYYKVDYFGDLLCEHMWIKEKDLGKYFDKKGAYISSSDIENKKVYKSSNGETDEDKGHEVTILKDYEYMPVKGSKAENGYIKIEKFYKKLEGEESKDIYISEDIFKNITIKNCDNFYRTDKDVKAETFIESLDVKEPGEAVKIKKGDQLLYFGKVYRYGNIASVSSKLSKWHRMREEASGKIIYIKEGDIGKKVKEIDINNWEEDFILQGKEIARERIDDFSFLEKSESKEYLNRYYKEVHPGEMINKDKRLREDINKVIYRCRSEWKRDSDYDKVLYGYNEKDKVRKERVLSVREKICFWEEGKKAVSEKGIYPESDLNWYYHPVRFIEKLKEVSFERVYNLKKVQDIAVNLPCFKEGGSGKWGTKKSGNGTTFCNISAFEIIKATDGNYKNLTFHASDSLYKGNEGYIYKGTNIWYDELVKAGKRSFTTGIIEIDGEEAQFFANYGYTVLGAWKNLKGGEESPHYATVRPVDFEEEYKIIRGPKIAHIGAELNLDKDKIWARDSFGGNNLQEVRWFLNTKQDFRIEMKIFDWLSWKKE